MKILLSVAGLAMLAAPLAACGGNGDDKLAQRVEDAADNRADQMEAQAQDLENRADRTREIGEQRGDAIDAADLNAQAMSNAQKDAIVANSAAAVR